MKDIVITHAKDVDGVSPVILLKLCNREVEYHLFETAEEAEELFPSLLAGDLDKVEHIYITDLPLSEKTYQWIEEQPWKEKVYVFDHHISHSFATKYPYVVLDTRECATSLFYKYLKEKYKEIDQPWIQEYVEHVLNLDMWYWVAKGDAIANELGLLFDIYGNLGFMNHFQEKLLNDKKMQWTSLEEELLKIERNRMERYFENKKEQLMKFYYSGYQMGVVFAEQYRSELGMVLQQANENLDFIAMINPSGGVSLRTQKDDVNLAELASRLNGGGHQKSSGFGISDDRKIQIIKMIFPDATKKDKNA